MNYRDLLGDIIKTISQRTTSSTKETNVEICYEIQQAAISIKHPFLTFED